MNALQNKSSLCALALLFLTGSTFGEDSRPCFSLSPNDDRSAVIVPRDKGGNAGNGVMIAFRSIMLEQRREIERHRYEGFDLQGRDPAIVTKDMLDGYDRARVCFTDEEVPVNRTVAGKVITVYPTCRNNHDLKNHPENEGLIECNTKRMSEEFLLAANAHPDSYAAWAPQFTVHHEVAGTKGYEPTDDRGLSTTWLTVQTKNHSKKSSTVLQYLDRLIAERAMDPHPERGQCLPYFRERSKNKTFRFLKKNGVTFASVGGLGGFATVTGLSIAEVAVGFVSGGLIVLSPFASVAAAGGIEAWSDVRWKKMVRLIEQSWDVTLLGSENTFAPELTSLHDGLYPSGNRDSLTKLARTIVIGDLLGTLCKEDAILTPKRLRKSIQRVHSSPRSNDEPQTRER